MSDRNSDHLEGNAWIVGRAPDNLTSTGEQIIRGGQGDTFIGGAGKSLIDARFYRTFEVYDASTSTYRYYDWNAIGSRFQLNLGWQALADYRPHVSVDTEAMAVWGRYVDSAGLLDGERIFVAQPVFTEAMSGSDGHGGSWHFDPVSWSFTVTDAGGHSQSQTIAEYARLIANPKAQTLIGGQGDSVLLANDAGNRLVGGGGVNVMVGGKGNDFLYAGARNDTLDGGQGDDTLQGGAGDSHLTGGQGNNTIEGGSGNETIYAGESGDDWATAGAGTVQYVAGGEGNDIIYGGGGTSLSAVANLQWHYGAAGNESIWRIAA